VTVAVAAKFQWFYHPSGKYGPALVAASERMLTTEAGGTLTEHSLPVRKGAGIGRHTYLLAGGAIQVHSQLLRELLEAYSDRLDAEEEDKNPPNEFSKQRVSVWELAEKYGELFRSYKRARAEERYLSPLGLTYDNYLSNLNSLPEAKQIELLNDLQRYHVDFEALLLGYDGSNTCILEVNGDGAVTNQDDIGYGAIGIGAAHASAHLTSTGFDPHRQYYDALWSTFCAKKRGEAAPGVGTDVTDMVFVNRYGWRYVDAPVVAHMSKTYDEMRANARERDQGIAGALLEFEKGLNEKGPTDAEQGGQAQRPPETVREPGEASDENKAAPPKPSKGKGSGGKEPGA
jgi:hypothetical protein